MKVDGPTQLDFSEQVTHSIKIFVLLGKRLVFMSPINIRTIYSRKIVESGIKLRL